MDIAGLIAGIVILLVGLTIKDMKKDLDNCVEKNYFESEVSGIKERLTHNTAQIDTIIEIQRQQSELLGRVDEKVDYIKNNGFIKGKAK